MSDSDRIQLAYEEETVYGVADGGTLQKLRTTGESLKADTSTSRSNEIVSDRQTSDIIRTDFGASGDINLEMSYGTYDTFMEMALCSAGWSSAVTITETTISFAESSGNTQAISDSGNGFGSINVGQWVRVSGAADAGNNGVFKVSAAAAGAITVLNPNGVTASAGASITVEMGEQITNGVASRSISIEKKFTDLTNDFEIFLGMMVDTFSLSLSANQIMTGSFGMVGKTSSSDNSTMGSGYDNPTTTGVVNAIDDIESIYENELVLPSLEFTLSLNNKLRKRPEIGILGPKDIGLGSLELSGTIKNYYLDSTQIDKYLNFTDSSLAMVINDEDGNVYVFDFPRVKFTSGPRNASGKDQDVIGDLSWEAYKDTSEAITIRIVRFDA